MKHIITFSGGESSAKVAIKVVEKYGKENVILVNHRCLLEPDDVYRFENEIANYLELPITYVDFPEYDTKDQFDVVIDKGSFINPNGGGREALCTHIMKTEPFMNWLSLNFPTTNNLFQDKQECIIYYGFDKSETDRIQRRSTIMAIYGYKIECPLAFWEETIKSTTEIGINTPNGYSIFKHANCIGCLKAGWQHWYCVYVFYPEIFKKGMLAESDIGHSIHKDAYLEDKIPLFDSMVKAGIWPTEKIQSQTWWAMVKRILKQNIEIDENEYKPCECLL